LNIQIFKLIFRYGDAWTRKSKGWLAGDLDVFGKEVDKIPLVVLI